MEKKVYIAMDQDMTSPEGAGFPIAVYATEEAAWDAAKKRASSRGYVQEVEAFGLFDKTEMDELAEHVAQGGQY